MPKKQKMIDFSRGNLVNIWSWVWKEKWTLVYFSWMTSLSCFALLYDRVSFFYWLVFYMSTMHLGMIIGIAAERGLNKSKRELEETNRLIKVSLGLKGMAYKVTAITLEDIKKEGHDDRSVWISHDDLVKLQNALVEHYSEEVKLLIDDATKEVKGTVEDDLKNVLDSFK